MKKILCFASGLLLLMLTMTACSTADDSNVAETKIAVEKAGETKTVLIAVEGMTCQGCVNSIESALAEVDGVVEQKVDLEEKSASITFDPDKTDAEDLAKVITDVGYTASIN